MITMTPVHFRGAVMAGLVITGTLALAAPASAQSADEQAAYVALIYTTVGGLSPLPPGRDTAAARGRSNLVWQGRLGRFTREGGLSATTFAVGAEWPRGRWRFGGTLALGSVTCSAAWEGDPDCAGDFMLGGTARTTFVRRALDGGDARKQRASNGSTLLVGFDGSVGMSPRNGEQALALAAAVPVAIEFQGSDLRITPFLTPGLGFGRLGSVEYEDDEAPTAHGTVLMMMGGGIGFEFARSGIGASLGFQKVLKSDAGATTIGLALTWQGPRLGR